MSTVTVTFDTDTANVTIARTVAAAMAARAQLRVDRLEDVRLAVDEAVVQVLAAAPPAASVTCRFAVGPAALHVTICAPTDLVRTPSTDTFGWTVLTALVDDLAADVADGSLTLRLRVDRPAGIGA